MTSSEFENHQIFEKLDQIISKLSEEETRVKIEIGKLNFFDSACKYILDRIKLTIPVLVPVGELNTISQELENAFSQINAFLGNQNIGHLNNAEANFNTAITRVRNLPIPLSKNDFNFSKSISNFENLVSSKLKEIEKENNSLKEDLKKVQANLVTKQNEIDKITELLATKTNEINTLTTTYKTDYENIKSVANQSFENERKTFRTEITTDREKYKNEISQDRETFRKEIDKQKNTIETESTTILKNIESKLEEAKKLVNVIGNVGVTGNYQNIANQHKKAANLWRILAIAFMTILSALLIYTIWDVSSANYDWIKSLIRVIAAAALSYPATYAARESSKHRKLEIVNRKLELELASLTPFIEMLPEEKKQEIKSNLVEKYFGNHVDFAEEKGSSEEELSLGGFEKILKAILPILKK
ncbi:hypothetical protein SAMN05444285_1674 [Draconibacterium orientale]|uniref:Uncharacterized protein n=1 Tax=Draconibacterium orientale TaxID=1168034 RepID=X5E270_9BACT|nr:hypothetical protein [Draconibacterium orientale]AHW61560.1 hypothetical protein FH5T_03750 [Draconibacterium orientale]SEU16346.1 hypothetical protein SAMN05444285_1674 [Draconibacterium orientale]